ncbi:RidA family protein [Tessaracoccus sp. OH4464_COT-324]|uniref:RidA family protein n=1 Tax=Tessaracoccus sp. OH4464_COT-324 TaxID=2491059 RepID=UPI000F63310D|nr:RidA family protein [Tessaracoccus sp. OH4464_COT-324]RRD46580.1 RidA family protein [Tessaracoccus sp. OH4464_COT-324]
MIISTDRAPQAIGPYSQAVRAGDFLFASGQIPLTPDGVLVEGDAATQATQCLDNVAAVLDAAGLTLANVVKVTVFLTSMADFAAVNEVYAERFSAPFPARSAVAVAELPKGAKVEIEVVARA